MITDEYGAVEISEGKPENLGEKPVFVALRSPGIAHGITRSRTGGQCYVKRGEHPNQLGEDPYVVMILGSSYFETVCDCISCRSRDVLNSDSPVQMLLTFTLHRRGLQQVLDIDFTDTTDIARSQSAKQLGNFSVVQFSLFSKAESETIVSASDTIVS